MSRYGNKKAKNDQPHKPELKSDKNGANGAKEESVTDIKLPDSDKDGDTERKIAKQKRHIRKLEKALRQCGRKIDELEQAEMDLEELDDENSSYLMETRYY